MPRPHSIRAPSLETFVAGVPYERIEYAQAGGGSYQGMEIAGVLEVKGILSPAAPRRRAKEANADPTRDFRLTPFLESPCLIVRGRLISRRTLVKYVANKLGGVHPIDFPRDLSKPERGR